MVNFSEPEGYIDSFDDPPLPDGSFLLCTYTVTVYTGYGVELQVRRQHAQQRLLIHVVCGRAQTGFPRQCFT